MKFDEDTPPPLNAREKRMIAGIHYLLGCLHMYLAGAYELSDEEWYLVELINEFVENRIETGPKN